MRIIYPVIESWVNQELLGFLLSEVHMTSCDHRLWGSESHNLWESQPVQSIAVVRCHGFQICRMESISMRINQPVVNITRCNTQRYA